MLENPFNELLSRIRSGLANQYKFLGVYLNRHGQLQIIKDANGKIVWYSSCALLYAEFLKRLVSDPKEYSKCEFYAINGKLYQHDKLLINLYVNQAVSGISRDMMLVFDAVHLNFHKKSSIGLFMPIQFNLDKINEKVHKDPSFLFEAAKRAKDLVFNETKPCTSCGELCHVPDVEDIPDITESQLTAINKMTEGNKIFCFDCGRIFMTKTAAYKIEGCTDFNKVNTVKSLSAEIIKMDFRNSSFDFDKAQNLLKDLMAHISNKISMTAVDNDKVTSATSNQNKPKVNFNLPANENIKPWMN